MPRLVAASCFGMAPAGAQPYPAKPVRMLVGFPPGGGALRRLERRARRRFATAVRQEIAKYERLVKQLNVKAE